MRHLETSTSLNFDNSSLDLPFDWPAMKDPAGSAHGKPKLPFLWTQNLTAAVINRLPAHYHTATRRRSRSNPSDVTALHKSFNPWDGIRDLLRRRWHLVDVQYLFLATLVFFSLGIAPSAPVVKTFALLGAAWILLMPATRQFFLPSVMIWVWLVYFFCSR